MVIFVFSHFPCRFVGTITEVNRVLSRIFASQINFVPHPPFFLLPSPLTSFVPQSLFCVYFSILAYDYISASPYGETLGLKPSALHQTFIKPYFSPKVMFGLAPSVFFNNISLSVAIIFSFGLRVQGFLVLLVSVLWVMCYGKAAAVQGNVQLLHDAVAPFAEKVGHRKYFLCSCNCLF